MDVFSDTNGEKYIYRYRQMNMFALDELFNNYVYLASIEELNDPFESNIDIDLSISEMSYDNKLKWLLSAFSHEPAFKDEITKTIFANPEKFKENLNDTVRRTVYWLRAELLEKESPVQKSRVACFSKTPFNPTMVSHYCGNNGVVIAYDRKALAEAGCALGEITYEEKVAEISIDHILNGIGRHDHDSICLRKYKKWEYEQEIRLINVDSSSEKNLMFFPLDSIKAVCFFQKTSPQFARLLNVVSEKNDIPLYKAAPNRHDYEYSVSLVDRDEFVARK
jgi:hypothetical protein